MIYYNVLIVMKVKVLIIYLYIYFCEFCGNEFRRKIDLDRYLCIYIGERLFWCFICGCIFI